MIRLFSGFSTDDIGLLRGTAQKADGSSVLSWEVQGEFFLPFEVPGMGTEASPQFLSAIKTVQSDLTGLPLSVPTTVFELRYDNAINRVVLTTSDSVWQITFNNASQKTFGFNASYSSVTIVTGSKAPYFVWSSTQDRRALDSFPYEFSAPVTERIADSGRTYSIGRRDFEKRRDWEFQLEPESNVFAAASSSLEPYNWERFIKNLREAPTPFLLMEDVTGSTVDYSDREALYEMRGDMYAFNPKSVGSTDYHSYWNIPVRTREHFAKGQLAAEFGGGTTESDWIIATGGTIVTKSIDGTKYAIHTFDSVGTGSFDVSKFGSTLNTVEYLVVAGGGGASGRSGGGGAGGVLTGSTAVLVFPYDVIVGNGAAGVGDGSQALNGENSKFHTFATAIGGGAGGGFNTDGKNGGSGGGAGSQSFSHVGGSGVVGQGHNGGDNHPSNLSTGRSSGGGGGWGFVGGSPPNEFGGAGGNGLQSSINGIATYYAGGGGGWGGGGSTSGGGLNSPGGLGGGGRGWVNNSAGTGESGTNGLGGGGGAGGIGLGGSGGSGIIIIRYPIQLP